ncbi:MAG: 50S ribosomal protein L21 [Verrucomicrobiota bacterium]
MYAIISLQGRQYKIENGSVLDVNRLPQQAGETMEMDNCILALRDDDGSFKTGTPALQDASVQLDIVEHFQDNKVTAFKMKRRKRYRRTKGHRQALTRIKVAQINSGK